MLVRCQGAAILTLALAGCAGTPGQPPYMVTVDVIECRTDYQRECLHFYEQNWQVFRQEALERNYISSFQLLRTAPEASAGITLLLMTEYADSMAFARAEENFQPLIQELRPDGPSLLSDVPRSQFVANRLGYVARPITSKQP